MNTLPKKLTLSILGEGGYERLVQHWRKMVKAHQSISAEHHLLYAVARGKDWRKGFTLPTNPNKRANGYRPAVESSLTWLHSPYRTNAILDAFEGTITPEGLTTLLSLVPETFGEHAYLGTYSAKDERVYFGPAKREVPSVVA